MNVFLRSVAALGMLAAAVAGLTVVAPYVGLGRNEEFILYRYFALTRSDVFGVAAAGAVVFFGPLFAWWLRHNFSYFLTPILNRIPSSFLTRIPAFFFTIGRAFFAANYRVMGIFVAVVAVGFLLRAEFNLRNATYEAYLSDPQHYLTLYYSDSLHSGSVDKVLGRVSKNSLIGLFKENTDINMMYLDKGGRVLQSLYFHLNNVGLFSPRDYEVERRSGEFRVVVLGNEQTATTTSSEPWPDILIGLLSEDSEFRNLVGGREIKVFNYGWPDAGFAHYPYVLSRAMAFKPDLVLINIARHDFERVRKFGPKRKKVAGNTTLVSGKIDLADKVGSKRKIIIGVTCVSEPVALLNPTCRVGRPHTFFTDLEVFRNQRLTKRIAEVVVSEYARGAIWRTWKPFLLRKLQNESLDPLHIRESLQPSRPKERTLVPLSDEEMVEEAVELIDQVRNIHPNILITRNVWLSELREPKNAFTKTRMLMKRLPDLPIVIMSDRLRSESEKGDVESWYNVPYDDVKWSKKGHRVYARAVVGVLKDYIRTHPDVVGYGEREK